MSTDPATDGQAGPQAIPLSEHPRAALAIARAKTRAGLFAFFAVAIYGHLKGLPFASMMGRALLAGIAANLVAWAVAIAFWRHVLEAEARAVAARRRARRVRMTAGPGNDS